MDIYGRACFKPVISNASWTIRGAKLFVPLGDDVYLPNSNFTSSRFIELFAQTLLFYRKSATRIYTKRLSMCTLVFLLFKYNLKLYDINLIDC